MNKIKEARAEIHMSQEELAKQAQISRPHLSNIENGEAQPTIDVAIRIAEALGHKVSDIFFKEDVV
jgi:putative transcriptional regulator